MDWEHTYSHWSDTRDCGAFYLDVVGSFAPDQIDAHWSPLRRTTNDVVEATIARAWAHQSERAKRNGVRLFDGRLCRLIHFHADGDGRLVLAMGGVAFREFVGTNATHAYLRYVHGPDVLADPVGVSVALATADGYVLLGRRSQRVLRYGGRIHPVGGMLEPAGDGQDAPDVFDAIRSEIREETGMIAEHLSYQELLGLVRDKHTVQPELIFDMTTDLAMPEIRRISLTAQDAEEHTEWVPVRNHPSAMVTFLEQHLTEFTPVALAALLLHGQRHWGSGWFASARGYLRSVI